MLDKSEVARRLANAHYEIEPGISRIFTIEEEAETEGLPSTPIKLLEVNQATVPSGVMPLYFGPAPANGIPFPSVIVEVTPDEFQQLSDQRLMLPNGWHIGIELKKVES